jgi:short-subunit dehydrogenase
MARRLRPIAGQVIVITGATSGVGLTTARMAARRGAKVVLAARDAQALTQLAQKITETGGQALAVPTDVGVQAQVAALGDAAVARFGRIDTWINNAGITIYGRHDQVPLADEERLFQTNFWGVVHGATVALNLMRQHGGAIVNLGSILSSQAVPLQGMYAASKHAVKGFTDALRMEIAQDGVPISVTLVHPAAIDTMLTNHARNFMRHETELPAPLFAPEVVAEAILYAACHRQRDIHIGAAARLAALGANLAPRLLDKVMELALFRLQRKAVQLAPPGRRDSLYASNGRELQQRLGGHESTVHESSPYTFLATRGRPLAWALLAGGALLAAWALADRASRQK